MAGRSARAVGRASGALICGLLFAAPLPAEEGGIGPGTLAVVVNTADPQSVAAARAGADVIAPSAAMDGQVQAIRRALDDAGFTQTAIMAYSTKFASALYGPFREAGGSALMGDRISYQMNPMNLREAIRESLLD